MRLFWIMAGVFFGNPGEIEKTVARMVAEVSPDPGTKTAKISPLGNKVA